MHYLDAFMQCITTFAPILIYAYLQHLLILFICIYSMHNHARILLNLLVTFSVLPELALCLFPLAQISCCPARDLMGSSCSCLIPRRALILLPEGSQAILQLL